MRENRTIKFRVWNNKSKSWVHGPHKIPSLDGCNIFGETILLGGFMDKVSIEDLNDCIPLQYTGLNDKNGRGIFEGDILKIPDNDNICLPAQNCEVIFDFNSFGIKCLNDDNMEIFCCLSAFEGGVLEVIGNKFENGDLIK